MSEFSRIMELRGKLDNAQDMQRLDEALNTLGGAFKDMLTMTKQLMQGKAPEKLSLEDAEKAVAALRELGAGRGYSLPEFANQKALCDFIVKFGSELING